MYFKDGFALKRGNYKTFKDFYDICKYYLNEYKKDKRIKIIVDKENFTLNFKSIDKHLRFY